MSKRMTISEEQAAEIEAARSKNKNKNVERRLLAVKLYAQGMRRDDISQRTGYSKNHICDLAVAYRDQGLTALVENHYPGNRRNLTFEEEAAVLAPFLERMKAGQIVDTKEILAAYEKALGRSTEKDHARIYRVLARHGWRKIMPRSVHPDKASEEEIALAKNKILCTGTEI